MTCTFMATEGKELLTEIAMNDTSVFPGKKCHNRYWPSSANIYLQNHCSSGKKVLYKD